ncbi:hypothetical protein WNY63_00525 [Pseudoalteromonas neustonica]|uniref:Uncharacterized protein n=1 Tax=Pseudoalteromonas neustonica TaxID=1840331 RepID=A0ABU9TWQ9_9GAMM
MFVLLKWLSSLFASSKQNSSSNEVKVEFGFDGSSKESDIDLQNFETKSQTINVDGENFNYNTLGPKGFDTQVKRSLTSIAKTDTGKEMLKSIAKGEKSLIIQFGPNNGAGIADGFDAGIVFNPKKGTRFIQIEELSMILLTSH